MLRGLFGFYISREVGNQGRTQARLRPSSISQAAFLPPYGGGTGWAPYLTTNFFPFCIYTPLGSLKLEP